VAVTVLNGRQNICEKFRSIVEGRADQCGKRLDEEGSQFYDV